MGKGKKTASAATEAPAAAGLSSFLLAQTATPLDDLFSSSKGATTAFDPKQLKPKPSTAAPVPSTSAPAATAQQSNDDEDEADLSEPDSDASLGDLAESDDDEDGVEEAYAARLAAERIKGLQGKAAGATAKGTKRKAEGEPEASSDEDDDEAAEDEDEDEDETDDDELDVGEGGPMDINDLVLGSLREKKDVKGKKAERAEKGKKSDKALKRAQETPEERDQRTVFLGNVPSECSTSKSAKKALVRHVLQNPSLALPAGCPTLKLDSIRFRSIAFASKVFGRKATSGSGEGGDEAGGRGRKRAREWREADGSDERGVKGGFKARETKPASAVDGRSGALTDAQKRRVAFIRGELNEGKSTCNAYLVIEALPDSVDVREVVQALVGAANNSLFQGATLHADVVRPRSAAALLAAAQMAAKPNPNLTDVPKNQDAHQVSAVEARRTIFVGGLDFAETEENVRKATEAVLVRERGEAGDKPYVESVRVVRDASSGLGKGFCYVLLKDDQCVDELLALPPGKNLKISKRKVRLERCKTSAAAARSKAATRAAANTAASSTRGGAAASSSRDRKPVRLSAPRDPTLAKHGATGAKAEQQAKLAAALADLPSDERKKLKSMDADRVARRAQKKEQKRLAERYERKQANAAKKAGGGAAGEILGRAPRAMERARKEKKRIRMQSKSTLKKPSAR
ncbi:hypothetical protein JCM10207_004926 [Rhodosporidiobolus poonsookiae]